MLRRATGSNKTSHPAITVVSGDQDRFKRRFKHRNVKFSACSTFVAKSYKLLKPLLSQEVSFIL